MSVSIRLEDFIDQKKAVNDLAAIDSFGIGTVYLELVVEGNASTGLPKINRTALVNLSRLLPKIKALGLKYGLILSESDRFPLFPEEAPQPAATEWFGKYRQELTGLHTRCQRAGSQPTRVVIGADFVAVEADLRQWERSIAHCRELFPGTPIVYSALVERHREVPLWAAVDEIGVMYVPPLDGNYKRAHRTWNRNISQLAQRESKPVFISHANITLAEKEWQLKNKFRFWAEEVELTGVNVNTVFGLSVLSDTTEYFALPPGSDARSFLADYIAQ